MKINEQNFNDNIKEFLFVLTPPSPMQQDVDHLKRDAEQLVGYPYKSRFAKAHITLGHCITDQPNKIIWALADKAQEIAPVTVHIKDCNTLHHGENRSICLDVVNKTSVMTVTENIADFAETVDTPHLTIARNLPYQDFLKAWPYFENVHYSQHFTCDHITVLQRAGTRWIPYEQIPLAG